MLALTLPNGSSGHCCLRRREERTSLLRPLKRRTSAVHPCIGSLNHLCHLQQMFVQLFPETRQQDCMPSSDNPLWSHHLYHFKIFFLGVSATPFLLFFKHVLVVLLTPILRKAIFLCTLFTQLLFSRKKQPHSHQSFLASGIIWTLGFFSEFSGGPPRADSLCLAVQSLT